MGTFRATIAIEHPALRGAVRVLHDVLVDTGAEATWVPRAIMEALGIVAERTEHYRMANGHILERQVGFALVHVANKATADDVVFGEEHDEVILGARSLEGLNLRVDARAKRLVDAGPIVTAASGGLARKELVLRVWFRRLLPRSPRASPNSRSGRAAVGG